MASLNLSQVLGSGSSFSFFFGFLVMDENSQMATKARLFQAIGEFVINFAMLETSIDLCVRTIHENCNGKKLGLELPITALNKKLSYLRSAINGGCELPVTPILSTLIERIEKMAEFRKAIVHGAISIEPDGEGNHEIIVFHQRKGAFLARFSIASIKDSSLQILRVRFESHIERARRRTRIMTEAA